MTQIVVLNNIGSYFYLAQCTGNIHVLYYKSPNPETNRTNQLFLNWLQKNRTECRWEVFFYKRSEFEAIVGKDVKKLDNLIVQAHIVNNFQLDSSFLIANTSSVEDFITGNLPYYVNSNKVTDVCKNEACNEMKEMLLYMNIENNMDVPDSYKKIGALYTYIRDNGVHKAARYFGNDDEDSKLFNQIIKYL